jgi:hypothetical protein
LSVWDRHGTYLHEISIPQPVRKRSPLDRLTFFSLITCIQLASHISSYSAHSGTSSEPGASGARIVTQ